MSLKIGLIVNPVAGVGGRVGLKGSDGADIQARAFELGAEALAGQRVIQMLEQLSELANEISWLTVAGSMGADCLAAQGYSYQTVFKPLQENTQPEDTISAVQAMQDSGIDLLVFAGGDGTARDVMSGLKSEQLCLGIPAGCKIYSGVFSVTPLAAAEVIRQIVSGDLFEFSTADVLDIDEAKYRSGHISTRLFGEMLIPRSAEFMQNVKVAGRESEDLVKEDIAAWIVEIIEPETLYLIASGSICMAIKEQLGIAGTLLGVDAILDGELLCSDASEQQLMTLIEQHQGAVKLIITPIGGQGILLGRGNHTICHRVIEQLGMKNTLVVASKGKLKGLQNQPLRLDTGKPELDEKLSGYISIITGYDDQVLYQLATL